MGKVPGTTNDTAIIVNKAIAATGGSIIAIAEDLIIAEVPFLGFPIIKQLWQTLFYWVVGYLLRALEQSATFAIIDSQIDAELKAVTQALVNLNSVAQNSGDPDAVKKAIQDYANAHSLLVHADGSAPIQ